MKRQTIHLKGIGEYRAIPVSALRVGDIAVWNGGGRSEILAIRAKGRLSIEVDELCGGTVYQRTMRLARLIAVADLEKDPRWLDGSPP